MDTVKYFKNEIRNWISWTEIHCGFSEDHLLLKTDLDDESDEYEVEPWIDALSIAFDDQGITDGSFRKAAEEVLAGDPLNIRARYVILEYLRSILTAEGIGIPEDIEAEKNEARDLISYIIPLAPVEVIADWSKVAWEVGQAGQNFDHDRAMRLFEHALAAELAPRQDIQLLRARHLFLAVHLNSIRDLLSTKFQGKLSIIEYGSQFVWHPSLIPHHFYQVLTGIPLFVADRLAGGNGVAGVAAASTAGNAATVPAIIAAANPVYSEAAKSATIIVAASVVVTAMLVPVVTAWVARQVGASADRGAA